jgi:hypothetical protein
MADASNSSSSRDTTEETIENAINKTIDFQIRFLFFPAVFGRRILKVVMLILVIVGLLLPAILIIPSVQNYLSCKWLHIDNNSNLLPYKYTLDLLSPILKVLTLLALGGAITKALFPNDPSKQVDNLLNKFQSRNNTYLTEEPNDIKNNIKNSVNTLLQIRKNASKENLTGSFGKISSVILDMYRSTTRVTGYYNHIILFGPILYFPGGIYGLLAFILLLTDILIGVGKVYVNYPPGICMLT